jgi:hypothetical protein
MFCKKEIEMRRFLGILACTTMFAAGPCTLESWNLAVNPGVGDMEAFVGVELDFGGLDVVVPLYFPGK